MDKSENSQMVLAKVNWAYSDVYLSKTCEIMQKIITRLNRPISLILQGYIKRSVVKSLETRKTRETKQAVIGSEEDRKTVAICFIDKNLGVNA